MHYLKIRDINFSYNKNKILNNFSLDLNKGDILGICGSSGCGKSTLLRIIAGLETPITGCIHLDDIVICSEDSFISPDKRGIGFVFQDYALFPHLNVEKNIIFGISNYDKIKKLEILKNMIKLTKLKNLNLRMPYELSGGQQQRVAIARSLAPKPKILLMDEPFSNLDKDLKKELRIEIKKILIDSNITCIIVSHDNEDVDSVCNKVEYMK